MDDTHITMPSLPDKRPSLSDRTLKQSELKEVSGSSLRSVSFCGEQIKDTQSMAQNAVKMVLGKDNNYLSKLLVAKLEGKERTYKRIPLAQMIHRKDRSNIRSELNRNINETQEKAIISLQMTPEIKKDKDVRKNIAKHHHKGKNKTHRSRSADASVRNRDMDITDSLQDSTQNKDIAQQAVTSWVINTVLEEKLKDREVRESADYWKYINGALAIVLPIITGMLNHYLTLYYNNCSSSSIYTDLNGSL